MAVDQGSLLLHFARNGAFGPDGADLLVLERGEVQPGAVETTTVQRL
mgnify:CR=1 FL=1